MSSLNNIPPLKGDLPDVEHADLPPTEDVVD